MVEIENTYKIYKKKFGYVNWLGAYSLWLKECRRFVTVWIQTIFSPLITSLLFLLVLSLAIGKERGDVLGYSFIAFLAPGLICMSAVIQQAFSHSSSSIMIGKMQNTLVDILYAPLTAAEITLAITLASCARSIVIVFVSILTFYFIIDLNFHSFLHIIAFTLLSSFIMGALGIIIGLASTKFDHMASYTNFIITPLSFLSGTFYTIDRLPIFLQNISEFNPFFYMIDGFRYGFLGTADGSVVFGLYYLIILSVLTWLVAYILFKKGYKIKS